MKKGLKIVAFVCAAVLMCSCASGANVNEVRGEENAAGKAPEEEKEYQSKLDALEPTAYGNVEGLNLAPGTYISVIGKAADGQYWEAVEAGANQAVSDINAMLGYTGVDRVKAVYSGPGEAGNVDEQVNILDEELARYPAAVAIAIIDSKSCGVQFDLASENNIPVVTFDSASDYQGIMSKISTKNGEAAAAAASKLAQAMNRNGEALLFVHDSKSLSTIWRTEGFVQKMETDYPNIRIGGIYYMDDFEDLKKAIADERNAAEGGVLAAEDISDEEVYDYIFEKHPNAKGIYATDGEAVMQAVEVCERLKVEDISIVGFDADDDQMEALREGKIEGLIVQNPYGMGYAAVVASARSILGLGNEAEVDSGYVWVDQKNIEDESIQKMLY